MVRNRQNIWMAFPPLGRQNSAVSTSLYPSVTVTWRGRVTGCSWKVWLSLTLNPTPAPLQSCMIQQPAALLQDHLLVLVFVEVALQRWLMRRVAHSTSCNGRGQYRTMLLLCSLCSAFWPQNKTGKPIVFMMFSILTIFMYCLVITIGLLFMMFCNMTISHKPPFYCLVPEPLQDPDTG